METITIDILNPHVLALPKNLRALNMIRVKGPVAPASEKTPNRILK